MMLLFWKIDISAYVKATVRSRVRPHNPAMQGPAYLGVGRPGNGGCGDAAASLGGGGWRRWQSEAKEWVA
jgi:hypothetical protein